MRVSISAYAYTARPKMLRFVTMACGCWVRSISLRSYTSTSARPPWVSAVVEGAKDAYFSPRPTPVRN